MSQERPLSRHLTREVMPVCWGHCGALEWTIERWGRVTHKHSCPRRTDPWCQTHPSGESKP